MCENGNERVFNALAGFLVFGVRHGYFPGKGVYLEMRMYNAIRGVWWAGILCLALLTGAGAAAEAESVVGPYRRAAPQRYRVRMELEVRTRDNAAIVYLPFPENGPSQDIESVEHSPGEFYEIPGSPGERLLIVTVEPKQEKAVVFNEFIATLWGCKVDFDAISPLHPYDKDRELYKQYTRAEPPYFDIEHEKVVRAADALAADAANDIEFARLAYHHVLENIKYNTAGRPPTHPLDDMLKKMSGGDYHAGSYFVTLLRRRGIPARNVAAMRVSGEQKQWQEFYLEGYGWIPVAINLTQRDAEPSSFFGMAVTPPYWRFRQPYSLVFGYTVQAILPGAEGKKDIKFTSDGKILSSGASSTKPRTTIEKLDD